MAVLSTEQKQSLAKRAESYHDQLLNLPEGIVLLDYLMADRGLDIETISRFQLGAVVDPDVSDELARGKICIPYLTPFGLPVALRFRRPPGTEDGPKYWQPSGSSITIFNTKALTQSSPYIVITEGEIDCMTVAQAGIPAVGLPGASSWRPHYDTLFEGYDRVVICADNDDQGAGQQFAERVAEAVAAPDILLFPDGHDVNSFTKEHGAAALRKFLKINQGDDE